MEDINKAPRKNPSRKQCEDLIKRILWTEVTEKGRNTQFRKATDFLPLFESLYPSSDGLTRQIQRALKELNLPKDSSGFLDIQSSTEEAQSEQKIAELLHATHLNEESLQSFQLPAQFLPIQSPEKDYLYSLLKKATTKTSPWLTIIDSSNGLIFLTEDPEKLKAYLRNIGR